VLILEVGMLLCLKLGQRLGLTVGLTGGTKTGSEAGSKAGGVSEGESGERRRRGELSSIVSAAADNS
jgi:hypothetical protein